MTGRAFPCGKGFLPLTRYLVHGEVGEHRDRAIWVESRNLPTEDPETAARLMFAHARATACPKHERHNSLVRRWCCSQQKR